MVNVRKNVMREYHNLVHEKNTWNKLLKDILEFINI